LIIFAGTRGYLDDVPRNQVADWEKNFLIFMHDQKPEIRNKIADTKDLDDETMKSLDSAVREFKAQYATKKEEEKAVTV
jgi:F-type H+-transporting ATPase subunit alpha